MVVAINKKYATGLSHIRLFDYPTVRELSLFLEQELAQSPGRSLQIPAALPAGLPVPPAGSYPVFKRKTGIRRTMASAADRDDKIAIIGMSGRYPQANGLAQYWDHLAEGRNAIVEVPASRWDVRRYYDPERGKNDKTYSKWLGALDDIDRFDPQVKQIPREDVERLRLRVGAEIEIDPIGITFRRFAGAYPGSDVRNLIPIEVHYSCCPRPQQVHSRKTML